MGERAIRRVFNEHRVHRERERPVRVLAHLRYLRHGHLRAVMYAVYRHGVGILRRVQPRHAGDPVTCQREIAHDDRLKLSARHKGEHRPLLHRIGVVKIRDIRPIRSVPERKESVSQLHRAHVGRCPRRREKVVVVIAYRRDVRGTGGIARRVVRREAEHDRRLNIPVVLAGSGVIRYGAGVDQIVLLREHEPLKRVVGSESDLRPRARRLRHGAAPLLAVIIYAHADERAVSAHAHDGHSAVLPHFLRREERMHELRPGEVQPSRLVRRGKAHRVERVERRLHILRIGRDTGGAERVARECCVDALLLFRRALPAAARKTEHNGARKRRGKRAGYSFYKMVNAHFLTPHVTNFITIPRHMPY